MYDRFYLADVAEELVSQAFALGCSLDKTCYVAELNSSIDSSLGIIYLRQIGDALIRHRHDSYVRLDRAERVVGCFCTGLGDSVE